MVEKESFLYLLIGLDHASKEAKLKKIKAGFFSSETADFNLDVLYAKDLKLKDLQEKLLLLPAKAKKRVVVIKGAESLKEDCRGFILKFAGLKQPKSALVLDTDQDGVLDEFFRKISRLAEVHRSSSSVSTDTFTLNRSIDSQKTDAALKILNQLLAKGERAERIMGGLRYSWERNGGPADLIKRKLRLLLNCDLEIKTGKLAPELALEKLVISLCARRKA
jgi:DNA polymerase III delta subunit